MTRPNLTTYSECEAERQPGCSAVCRQGRNNLGLEEVEFTIPARSVSSQTVLLNICSEHTSVSTDNRLAAAVCEYKASGMCLCW